MKKLLLLVVVAITAMSVNGQTLPKPSPTGSNTITVGVTQVTIDYSRPGVKDREIFGNLLPFGELWRFGANGATVLTVDTDVEFEGGSLKAGSYAVYAIPNEGSWEIIFNRDTKSSTQTYKEDLDVLRLEVEPMENSFTETFTLEVDKIRDNSAALVMLWEKTRVEIPFTVNTNELAVENIKKALEEGKDLGKVNENAANFYYSTLKDNKTALKYVSASVKSGETYRNLFLKARILKELGEDNEAKRLASNALDLANKEDAKGYANFISGTLDSWKKQ